MFTTPLLRIRWCQGTGSRTRSTANDDCSHSVARNHFPCGFFATKGARGLPWAGRRPYAPSRGLPRYPSGRPKPESPYPHTQLGTRKGIRSRGSSTETDGPSGTSIGLITVAPTGTPTRINTSTVRMAREVARDRCGHEDSRGSPMPMIEIWDGSNVHLSDLLDQVSATDLEWSVMELWAVARDDDTDIVALEQQAAESPTGLAVSGEQLQDLAGRLTQLIDGIVAGHRGTPPVRSDADLRAAAEIVIEAIDATLWRVYARNPAVIDRLRHEYDDVRDVVPEIAIPPVHVQS